MKTTTLTCGSGKYPYSTSQRSQAPIPSNRQFINHRLANQLGTMGCCGPDWSITTHPVLLVYGLFIDDYKKRNNASSV